VTFQGQFTFILKEAVMCDCLFGLNYGFNDQTVLEYLLKHVVIRKQCCRC
jgi:hypothetical protein